MIQIIEENRKPTTSEKFGQALSGLTRGFNQYQQQSKLAKQLADENEAAKRFGIDLTGIHDPKQRQEILSQQLRGQNERELAKVKEGGESAVQQRDYDTIKSAFGEKFANVYRASTKGGQTDLLKMGLDATLRGQNVDELLSKLDPSKLPNAIPSESPEQIDQKPIKKPQLVKGQLPKDYEWPDFTKAPLGYTPKDWRDEKKEWRKENAPLFSENAVKLSNNKKDEMGIKSLNKLNNTRKVGEGFEASLINPETGDFYGAAQQAGLISKEAQLWNKEIARFQNRAKDAFGSRVTNFDLQSYMRQFPGLLNTYEGRKNILKMMQINNQLDQLYQSTLDKVYKKYGLGGISQEEAKRIAEDLISDETEKLEKEYFSIDSENENVYAPIREANDKVEQDLSEIWQ